MIDERRNFAFRLACLIESGALEPAAYIPWCDAMIEAEDLPPYWVLELSLKRDPADAVEFLREFAFSEPFVEFADNTADLYIAGLFLRYEKGDLTWGEFMTSAGWEADAALGNCIWECEDFYHMARVYKRGGCDGELECLQRDEFLAAFHDAVNIARCCLLCVHSWGGKT